MLVIFYWVVEFVLGGGGGGWCYVGALEGFTWEDPPRTRSSLAVQSFACQPLNSQISNRSLDMGWRG